MADRRPEDFINLFEALETRYQDLFHNTKDAICIGNLKGNIIGVNGSATATETGSEGFEPGRTAN